MNFKPQNNVCHEISGLKAVSEMKLHIVQLSSIQNVDLPRDRVACEDDEMQGALNREGEIAV